MAILMDVFNLGDHHDIQLYTDAEEYQLITKRFQEISQWLLDQKIPFEKSPHFVYGWKIPSRDHTLLLKLTHG
ncbi:hypothetical protein D3C87_587960 [compost metagenome]